jgi:glycogen(starch) synthase
VATVNVCVSKYLAERADVPRSVTIYNPVSDKAFKAELGSHQHDDVVVFAGRLVAEKGLDVLLHAVAMLPGVRLRIAGDGPMKSVWQRLAAEMGMGDRAEFLGAKSLAELAGLYANAAVVCVPSAWEEPFGYTAAEAMAMGRAVVATPSGALPELLADGRGFVAAAATPQVLAETLLAALEDDDRRKSAERKARDFALNTLSVDCVGPKYEALYEAAAS